MSGKVTPAVTVLVEAGVEHRLHEYDPSAAFDVGFGMDAANQLGLDPGQVFKTLVIELDKDPNRFGVVVAPSTGEVDLRAAAGALGAKKGAMADVTRVERITGYVHGGISPFGQRKALPTVLDETSILYETIFVSGGRRGLEIEIAPDDLVHLLSAEVADIARA